MSVPAALVSAAGSSALAFHEAPNEAPLRMTATAYEIFEFIA
jgi:hypothetical protein